jgi:hypothetical protein
VQFHKAGVQSGAGPEGLAISTPSQVSCAIVAEGGELPVENLHAAWIGILLGFTTGALIGLRFHDQQWAGGYASWRRRLMRLGHISFFGLAFINLAFYLTVAQIRPAPGIITAGALFIVGAATMPAVCFLSAWRIPFRRLFFVPVGALIFGALDFIVEGLWGCALPWLP